LAVEILKLVHHLVILRTPRLALLIDLLGLRDIHNSLRLPHIHIVNAPDLVVLVILVQRLVKPVFFFRIIIEHVVIDGPRLAFDEGRNVAAEASLLVFVYCVEFLDFTDVECVQHVLIQNESIQWG